MVYNYVSKYSFSKMFTDIFLDEMMTYLRIASNQFRGLGNERGFRKKQGDHGLKLVKQSDVCLWWWLGQAGGEAGRWAVWLILFSCIFCVCLKLFIIIKFLKFSQVIMFKSSDY